MSDNDLKLVGGDFLKSKLPKDKKYLEKYFRGDLQRRFIVYLLTFGEWTQFPHHTGYKITTRWMKKLNKKFRIIESVYQRARENLDFEIIEKISCGKMKIKEIYILHEKYI